jgi:hypothetical protein
MPFLSVTRLRLKSRLMTPRFMKAIQPTYDQLMASQGYIKGKTLLDFSGGAWTMTLWEDQASMQRFYQSGAHRELMKSLAEFSCEAAVRSAPVDSDRLISWREAGRFMNRGARFNPGVKEPTANHMARHIPLVWLPLLNKPLPRQPQLTRHGYQG